MEEFTAPSSTPGDPMNSLIEAAAASSSLDVTDNTANTANSQAPQDLSLQADNSTLLQDHSSEADEAIQDPDTTDAASEPSSPSTPPEKITIDIADSPIIDIADSPIKTNPPWMTTETDSPIHTALSNTETPTWFSHSLPPTYSELSTELQSIRTVEDNIRGRFPKCQPMVAQMIEFLSHTTVAHDATSIYHTDTLLGNKFATTLPLVYFSNLIFSKALLINMASRSFKATKPKHKNQKLEPLQLWGMNVPYCEDQLHTYQFWVVHLKGHNGVLIVKV